MFLEVRVPLMVVLPSVWSWKLRCGVSCCSSAVDGFFVDDGDSTSVFVDAVPVCYLVAVRRF